MTLHTDNVVERPADLTARWLTAAVGAGIGVGWLEWNRNLPSP